MPDLKETFIGVLVDTLGFTTEEATALIDADGNPIEGAKESILDRNKQAVAKVKQTHAEAVKKAKDAGLGEKGKWYESRLKGLGIELGDATGDEAIEKVKDHMIQLAAKPADGKALDEEGYKNSKFHRDYEKKRDAEVAAQKAEFEGKWTERDAKEQRERTLMTVKDKAKTILDGLKPVLSSDPDRARNQLGFFYSELEKNGYDIDGDSIYVMDAEGKRVETDQGKAKRFDDYVKETAAKLYDFQVSDQKTNAGNVAKDTKQGGGAVVKPANRKEYTAQMQQLADDHTMKPEEKAARFQELKAYEAQLAG